MDAEKRLKLVKEVGEEIITEGELENLLETSRKPLAYDGFEPSGKIHVAQGLLRAINVNKMTRAGCRFSLLVADWHAWANNKLGGDLNNIKKAGHYMEEVWKAAGMDMKNVKFMWASDFVKDEEYWEKVMKVAMHSTVKRIVRTGQIMGRSEAEVQRASQILYPCMQAADIFHMEVDIAQLGLDQRKVNVLARELAPKLGCKKPVAVHHHMLLGLAGVNPATTGTERAIEMKMSKSNPLSAIFMTDSQKEVEQKINKAYCPEKQVTDNPVLEYSKFIVFEKFREVKVERPQKFGGDVSYGSYAELEKDFSSGKLHPMDLKQATARRLNELLEPVRRHFERNAKAKRLLAEISSFSR